MHRQGGDGLATVLALLSPDAARAHLPPSPPPLTDDRGRTLTLRGWNVGDKQHRGAEALSAITQRHFQDLHDQGFGFARLLVSTPQGGPMSATCARRSRPRSPAGTTRGRATAGP